METVYLSEAIVFKDHDVKEIVTERNGREARILQLEGIFQEADTENRNGRVYPMPILERESNKLMKSKILAEGMLIGEMEHPQIDPTDKSQLNRASKVLYERGCIGIKNLSINGKNVIGRCEILEDANQLGSTLASMVRRGLKPGISSRAIGSRPSMDHEGRMVVGEDINFITFDCVSDPSVFNARLSAVMSEEFEMLKSIKKVHKKLLWNVLEDISKKIEK